MISQRELPHGLILGAVLLALECVGCGGGVSDAPKLVPAHGSVTYNGRPLPGATVSFYPEKGPAAMASTDLEGKFTLTTGGRSGVVHSKCKVTITKIEGPVLPMTNPTPEDMKKMYQGGTTPQGPKSLIPEKYANPATSGLEADVSEEGSKNDFVFPLVD